MPFNAYSVVMKHLVILIAECIPLFITYHLYSPNGYSKGYMILYTLSLIVSFLFVLILLIHLYFLVSIFFSPQYHKKYMVLVSNPKKAQGTDFYKLHKKVYHNYYRNKDKVK